MVKALLRKIRNDLVLLNLFVIFLIIAITFFPSNGIRIVLGLPFLLFFPGYTLIAALFPRKGQMEAIERTALSFGMSIAIVPLIGLALNYTSWGIRLEPVLYAVSAFIIIVSIIAWFRRRRLPEQEQFAIPFQLKLPGWGKSVSERILSVALVVAILGALGTLGYVVAFPKQGEKFTEFYILDEAGKMADYPQTLAPGATGNVVLGIVNHEYQEVTYRIEIRESGAAIKEVGPVTLPDEQKWEQKVDFTPVSVGDNQKVEFLLFKASEVTPYQSLHLWINVGNGKIGN